MSVFLVGKNESRKCDETIAYLKKWLTMAEAGVIVGVAIVAFESDGACTFGTSGSAGTDVNSTIGALTRLSRKIEEIQE